VDDYQGAGDKSGMGIVSGTLMIERSKRLDYDLAPLLSSLPNVSRMVTRRWNEGSMRALLMRNLLFLLVGRVGLEPTTY
jgi:hypothetical protein